MLKASIMEPQNNHYDFIMNSSQNKKSLINLNGTPKKQKILFLVIIIGIVLIIFTGLIMSLGGGSKTDSSQLYKIAANQQDLIALIKTNSSNLKSQQNINNSATSLAIITSQAGELSTYFKKHGLAKVTSKQVKAHQNSKYIQALSDAKANGNYEDSYAGILASRLDEYRSNVKTLYSSTGNQQLKTILSNYFDQLSLVMASQTPN